MAFPEDALAPHEQLVLNLHPHPWVLVKPGVVLVVACALGVLALQTDFAVLMVLAAIVILVAAGWFVSKIVAWYSEYFVLTSDRVMRRTGVFRHRTIEIPLDNVNTVMCEQSLFERLLRIGDIEIESASEEGNQVFQDLRRPSDVRKDINIQREENENRKFDRARPAPSIADQINDLAELRDRGLITEAEFEAKRRELLERM
jgi:uncharacterized membrane protein YdbT with pleckstrin-like domain